jgi:hypothetical protein
MKSFFLFLAVVSAGVSLVGLSESTSAAVVRGRPPLNPTNPGAPPRVTPPPPASPR